MIFHSNRFLKWLCTLFLIVLAGGFPASCNTESKAKPYAELTPAEKARIALDARDFPRAVALYSSLIEANPLDYESYRFLAAAYSELGGFDFLKAIAGTLNQESTSLIASLSKFLPASPSEAQIEAMGNATATLLRLPPEQRSHVHPEIVTSSSGAQQLEFYQAAYSVIYLNKFTQITPSGAIDPSRLDEMTDADVDNILNNFESIATAAGGGAFAEGASEFIEQLDATPGDTRRDKLLSYLNSHPQ